MIAVKGIQKILLLRPLSLQGTDSAKRIAFQTEHEVSSSRDSDSTATKDGNIVSLADETIDISLTAFRAQEDTGREVIEEAYHAGEVIEFWDINKTEATTATGNKYPATYYQGYITEWSETSAADGNVEISISANINGAGVRGEATLTKAQLEVVQYAFADTVPQNP